MVDRIYPTELQLNRANSSDTEVPFWILIYVYLMVQFPQKIMINGTILILIQSIFLFWMVMSSGVSHIGYTYSSNLSDFNCRNKALTAKLLGRAIVSLNFVMRFRNFIADTVPW